MVDSPPTAPVQNHVAKEYKESIRAFIGQCLTTQFDAGMEVKIQATVVLGEAVAARDVQRLKIAIECARTLGVVAPIIAKGQEALNQLHGHDDDAQKIRD